MRKLLRNSLIEIFIMCIVVVVISWFVFPEWRSKESGIIELVGVSFGSVAVILGVIVGISDLVNNSKDIAKEPELIPLQEVTLEEKERVHKKSDSKVTETTSILFLAADPTDASRLRLGEEFREIQEKLKLARLRDRFKLATPQLSVRPTDISQALLDKEPQIVHFAGHGTSSGALCFENQSGGAYPVQAEALATLFKQFTHHVNCVLLNACYSKDQAKAISKHINYVIGMNKSVSDEASIAFTIGFYQALGAGRTIEEAYELGCAHIELLGISEYQTPVLIKKGQIPQQAGIPKKRKADALRLDEIFDVVKNSNPSDWNVNFNQGTEIAVFKSAPALRIETRSNSEFIHNNDFYENWVNKFSDSHAVSYYYHLYYGSSRLKEFILVSVDGGRALLPLPNSQLDLGVDPLRYKIAMIFDESNTCQDYMKRAGLYVVD